MDKIPMTAAGHVRLQEELKNLKSVERPAIIRAIAEARAHGDLSENAEYHAARERQSFIEGRIGELEDITKHAEVIDTTKIGGSTVRFGATVTLADEENNEESVYQVVGKFEADIKAGRISIVSPLGRALIGKTAGDSVEVETPNGTRYYEVVKVSYR
ncbi:MAG: transcription elongation factor GreA [Alphaproteobacteria bacterium]|nr:transcription elongation factor GreA [Alphaproteobacteria bacterium]